MKLYSFVGLFLLLGLIAWGSSSGGGSSEQCGWACQNARASQEDLRKAQAADNARREREARGTCKNSACQQ